MFINYLRKPSIYWTAILLLITGLCSAYADEPWQEPQDTELAIFDPDLYAWKLFVALNWPADVTLRQADPDRTFGENDYVVWEAWKLSSGRNDEVFLKEGKDPGPWLDNAEKPAIQKLDDLEALPLQQMSRLMGGGHDAGLLFDPSTATKGRNENHLNKAAYDFIRENELYHIGGQEKFYDEAVRLRDQARRRFDEEGILAQPHEYRKKLINFPVEAKEVKAQWREISETDKPRYRWQEFIDDDGSRKLYGLTSLHITTKDLPNWLWATFEHVDNPGMDNAPPWILPSNDSSAGPDGYPEGLGIKGTRWENYRLRGTQIDFFDPTGKPTILANSQIEDGFQTTSSCITCHAMAAIGPRTGKAANRLPIFEEDYPVQNQPRVSVGPIGAPQSALFESKTFTDDVIGKVHYVQADFVWSLMRAKRQPE